MESIWSKTERPRERPVLSGDIKVDVAVIGGGMAGVLTAFFLQERNIKSVILEGSGIGSGQTKNTTAKITSQHNLIYDRLIKNFGEEDAKRYADANERAIKDFEWIVAEKKIDCSLETCPAFLYSQEQRDALTLELEATAAEKLGINAEFTTQAGLPFRVAGAVKFHGQAQFNPLAFLYAVAKNLDVFERTKALSVEGNRVVTDNGSVTAEHIVFATHFPFMNLPGFYFAKMHQDRSYVLALEGVSKLDGMYLGVDSDAISLRSFGDALLFGGGSHRTGENSAGGKYAFLHEKAGQFYPQAREVSRWSAQDCITLDGVPYIGQFSASKPNWHVATGFGKWGMTGSMVSASIISDDIAGLENQYAKVFSPLRFKPKESVKAFISDIGQAVEGLSKQTFSTPSFEMEELPRGRGGIVKLKGKKVGAYRDDSGEVHTVSTRCPHLGCQVEWNPDEKSWDCPCHGSRFDHTGKLIDNPAQTDLESPANG